MNTSQNEQLDDIQVKVINRFGKLFKDHGRNHTMGLIYGLLQLLSKTRETGLTQYQISHYIKKSVSTISRTLELMVNNKFCNFFLDINQKNRIERKYYAMGTYKEFSIKRIANSFKDAEEIKKDLENIIIHSKEIYRDEMPLTTIEQIKTIYIDLDEMIKYQNKFLELLENIGSETGDSN